MTASADRRPVDPPPVVKLQIYEGDFDLDNKQKNDITFAYSANFFLFATLESARPIAHGRGQPATAQPPVLTGMPVSGMAYLDRPEEAGYFIFPDLSVRHEGKYRLSFNLYEQTKETDDRDPDAELSNDEREQKHIPVDSSFSWRMEVKSKVFHVFSAKKFPGLHESTGLSRTIAEQGCRVRIRRDVRMRRREGKGNGEFGEGDSGNGYRDPRSSIDYPASRERSRSLSSEAGEERGWSPQRRLSGEYVTPQGGNLGFGGAPPQGAQFAAPSLPPATASYQQNNALSSYNHAAPYAPQPGPYREPERQQLQQQQPQQYQPSYMSNIPREREFDEQQRRVSGPIYGPPHPSSQPPLAALDTNAHYRRTAYHHRVHSPLTHSPSVPTLAPFKYHEPVKFESPKYSPPHAEPLASIRHPGSAFSSSLGYERADRSYIQYSPPGSVSVAHSHSHSPDAARNGKRTYDAYSGGRFDEQPLRNGSRPSIPNLYNEEEDLTAAELDLRMQYKRADGRFEQRELPTIQ
jgi:hypothetical protein